ncbi:lipid A-modifier LpxR family protein [Allitabrizicola rongguiensis]|uniref:lipid A-modifier LpxR family protein n=1 Tax=Alitabrizicola rongguiensis TaxID=2909234 RepID=UPI001F2F7E68|nr:lipid A-modifier LpxR family protein [Tabrizicola rongguiensis]
MPFLFANICVAGMALVSLSCPVVAQERTGLGWGRLFNNDGLADQEDRWRTGSYTVSRVVGPEWSGELPTSFGAILEYRFRGEIIAPNNLEDPAENDRDYAGNLSFGVHTHWAVQKLEASVGLDLVMTGEQTGLASFQEDVHRALNFGQVNVSDHQIDNGLYPTLLGEIGRRYQVGPSVSVRPFAEAQAGAETYIRLGADVLIGQYWVDSLPLRDSSTGQLYRGIAGNRTPGLSFLVGGDYAYVFDSVYLPSGEIPELANNRGRLRAGMYAQGDQVGFFYGLTWLGREFEGQPHNQVVGSLRIDIMF